MPLQSLQQSYERSTPAFNQKLGQVVGFFQNVQQSQMAKQQMSEQMQQRQDIATFQADLQLENQKEYFDHQQEVQFAQHQQQIVNQSFEEAKDVQKELVDLINKEYPEVLNHNLIDYHVEVDFNDATGRHVPNIILNNQAVDYQTFRDEVTTRADFAKELERVRQNKEEYSPGVYTETGVTIGPNNVENTINNVRNDPEQREQLYALWRQGNLQPAQKLIEEPDDVESQQIDTPRSDVFALLSEMKHELGESGTFEASLRKKGRLLNLWDNSQNITHQFDFRDTIPNVRGQVESTLKDIYDIDLSRVRFDSETWQAITANDRSDLGDEERKLARRMSDSSDSQDDLPKLMKYYRAFDWAFREWSDKADSEFQGANLGYLYLDWPSWTPGQGFENLIRDVRSSDAQGVVKAQQSSRRFLPTQ